MNRTRAVSALRLPSLTARHYVALTYSWYERRTFERARECREFIYLRLKSLSTAAVNPLLAANGAAAQTNMSVAAVSTS